MCEASATFATSTDTFSSEDLRAHLVIEAPGGGAFFVRFSFEVESRIKGEGVDGWNSTHPTAVTT